VTLAQVNKVHHVHTIARVAEMLGEDEDWLWDVASEMDQEDGLIWVYGMRQRRRYGLHRLWHRNTHRTYRLPLARTWPLTR